MASSKWPGRNSFAWMNSSGGAWPHSKTPAKSSLTQMRVTVGRKSPRKHWFRRVTHDSGRCVSKPGSLNLHSVPPNTHDTLNGASREVLYDVHKTNSGAGMSHVRHAGGAGG